MIKRSLIIISMTLTALACTSESKKIAYVENYKLHSAFDLTNELDEALQMYSAQRGKTLDSLKQVFEVETKQLELLDEIPEERYQAYNELRNVILYRQKAVDEDVYAKTQEYDAQIWERLNLYIKEYALANDYDFILGASGSGNLMYAKEAMDLTDNLILYCNEKYNGKAEEVK